MSTASDEELASIAQHITIRDDDDQITSSSMPANDLDVLTNGTEDLLESTQKDIQVECEADERNGKDDTPSSTSSGENGESHDSNEYKELEKRIHSLFHEVALLLDRIYEIQELRHSSIPSTLSTPSAPSRIDTLLSSLSDSTLLLRPQITSLSSAISSYTGSRRETLKDGIEEIMEDWKRVEDQQKWLLEEMKEDGWLIRFRTTADQAEAMMDPLQKSLTECQAYVERISNSSAHVPLQADFDDQLSIERLQKLSKGHESMTRTYVPSINKILKMMDKSISDRPIKNGESLRRFGEMNHRWTTLQKQLQQLNAKIRLIISQHENEMEYLDGGDDVELLADVTSPYSSAGDSRSDYFGYGSSVKSRESTSSSYGTTRTRESTHNSTSRPSPNHRSSLSSGVSTSSTRSSIRQPLAHTHTSPSVKPPSSSTLSPDTAMRPLPLRRRTSMMSSTSSSTARNTPAEKPRWNSSPKVPVQTPTMPRRSVGLPRSVSPTPSNASIASTTMSNRRLSRIPVASPTSKSGAGYSSPTASEVSVPGLTVSNSHSRTLIAEPSSINRNPNQSHLERARMGLKTPEPPRPRLSSTFSSFSRPFGQSATPPGMSRNSSFGSISGTTPRTLPTRGKAPPSSFRITSPTPSGSTRPSSRLSVLSYSNFNTASQDLVPFVPSRYDLLDMEISKIMREVQFNLFVSRLDAAMKRGQRRNENEEWKGEYLFGRSERPSSVKLISIAGLRKPTAGTGSGGNAPERRVKCMIRVGGQWVDLKGELERRMRVLQAEGGEDDDETF
ncbi:hypothetical protein I302_102002 [Kwoniella bestiolae CBS 10118]|uniref:GAR domain-containing protein n=1 Tax=Kwoniella bestiolae CBS 10118 TaxID=1296100 RepID=A0A1B9GDR9_9TREE|nr:hypothetical protein I302_00686 [Kwoniella bestiolae CBS 10118]OCF29190.1 hypothetical protein I302_00686 [Kwoniella bestiolae CBS 10118]